MFWVCKQEIVATLSFAHWHSQIGTNSITMHSVHLKKETVSCVKCQNLGIFGVELQQQEFHNLSSVNN